MSFHREHVKHGVDSSIKSRKQQPIILAITILADPEISFKANISRYLPCPNNIVRRCDTV